MANIEHSSITDPDIHEPKGIAAAAVDTLYIADGAGSGAYAKIDADNVTDDSLDIDTIDETSIKNLNTVFITTRIPDLTTAGSHWVVIPVAGTIENVWSVIDATIDTADITLTLERSGVALTGGVITIAYSGSAAGDVDTCAPSANNDMTAALPLEIVMATTNTQAASAVITIELAVT